MGESNGIGRKWSLSPSGACADVLRASFTAKKIKKKKERIIIIF